MKTKTIILVTTLVFSFFLSCKKTSTPVSQTNAPSNPPSDLVGSKWHVYQYKDATMSTPQTRNDTLSFISATNYKYNNQPYTYYLTVDTYTHLSIYSTPFGDLSATVPANFITNGEMVDVPFSQLKASPQTFYMWMKKL